MTSYVMPSVLTTPQLENVELKYMRHASMGVKSIDTEAGTVTVLLSEGNRTFVLKVGDTFNLSLAFSIDFDQIMQGIQVVGAVPRRSWLRHLFNT